MGQHETRTTREPVEEELRACVSFLLQARVSTTMLVAEVDICFPLQRAKQSSCDRHSCSSLREGTRRRRELSRFRQSLSLPPSHTNLDSSHFSPSLVHDASSSDLDTGVDELSRLLVERASLSSVGRPPPHLPCLVQTDDSSKHYGGTEVKGQGRKG
jgi:hypothetical protein